MKIGVADTTFARADMGKIAIDEIKSNFESVEIVRYTVPGIKDLPVACKRLIEEQGCVVCIALGMPGGKPIDRQCAHEASLGIIQAQLLTNRHIVEVFVHEDEAASEKELLEICENRARKHARNAVALARGGEELSKSAGTGRRQGKPDVGPVRYH